MTKKEKKVLENMMESIAFVGVESVTYEFSGGKLYRKEHQPFEETKRLMSSPDYKKGYETVRDRVFSYLKSIGIERQPRNGKDF